MVVLDEDEKLGAKAWEFWPCVSYTNNSIWVGDLETEQRTA